MYVHRDEDNQNRFQVDVKQEINLNLQKRNK